MSIFSFPRINVKGLMSINVATANNDDYSGMLFPESWGRYAGMPVRLADSNTVQPLAYGMDDATFIEWCQKVDTFVNPASEAGKALMTKAENVQVSADDMIPLIPGEWNYFGDMGLTMMNMQVLGVVTAPGVTDTNSPLMGATISFKNRPGDTGRSTGMLIDVNAESVPCSQVITENLLLEKNGEVIFTGQPTKACTRWINFQRNTDIGGPNGAAGYFQCIIPLAQLAGQPILKYFPTRSPSGAPLAGLMFRYNIYRSLQPINTYNYPGQQWFTKMVELYKTKGLNPDISEVSGTIAPWYQGEMESAPVGRQLVPTGNTIPLPNGSRGNGAAGGFRLAPAVASIDSAAQLLSIDLSGSLPDQYEGTFDPMVTGDNPKFNFGPITLEARMRTQTVSLGTIDYTDTNAGDASGWVFDFSLKNLTPAQRAIVESGVLYVTSTTLKDLMEESTYYLVSDQSCIYGEQNPKGGTASSFMNDGRQGPATVRVFRKGIELTPANCPPITVWGYDVTPNQIPGKRTQIATGFKPGDALTVAVDGSGNRLYTFTMEGQAPPPVSSNNLNLMLIPQISLRLLPNNTDYSQYYVNPTAPNPVGNDKLTFDVIFAEVFRNYYLLYPAMNERVPLNDPEYWAGAEMARRLMERTQLTWWAKAEYMPRTRDLSQTRRTLIHAWCRKYFTPPATETTADTQIVA